MADLDDFFARKDKKKKSKGKKSKIDKDKEGGESSGVDQLKSTGNEESEWVEKEEPPTEISLEGLKVHSMNTEEDGEKVEQPKATESSSDNLKPMKQSTTTTAWQPVDTQPDIATVSAPSSSTVVTPTTTTTTSGGGGGGGGGGATYVPPGRRNAAAVRKGPPDIASDRAFPSLSSTARTNDARSQNGSRDGRMYTELKLSNKFSALRTD